MLMLFRHKATSPSVVKIVTTKKAVAQETLEPTSAVIQISPETQALETTQESTTGIINNLALTIMKIALP